MTVTVRIYAYVYIYIYGSEKITIILERSVFFFVFHISLAVFLSRVFLARVNIRVIRAEPIRWFGKRIIPYIHTKRTPSVHSIFMCILKRIFGGPRVVEFLCIMIRVILCTRWRQDIDNIVIKLILFFFLISRPKLLITYHFY